MKEQLLMVFVGFFVGYLVPVILATIAYFVAWKLPSEQVLGFLLRYCLVMGVIGSVVGWIVCLKVK